MIYVVSMEEMEGGGGEAKRAVVKREEEAICLRGRTDQCFLFF